MKRILIIEDDANFLKKLEASFNDNGTDVIACGNKEQSIKAIDSNVYFDAVVLDWYFESPEVGDPDIISKLLLKNLKEKHFRPVFVYTNNLTDFQETDLSEIGFSKNLIKAFDKNSIDPAALKNEIARMLQQNISLQLASAYREKIRNNFEKILFELNELPNSDIATVLKNIVGEEQNIDWSSDFILNLIHRALISDDSFVAELKTLLLQSSDAVPSPKDETDKRRLVNKMLYFSSKSDCIKNGDVVSVTKDGGFKLAGVVITPDCDLEQKKTRFIEIIELRRLDDGELSLSARQKKDIQEFKHPSFYFFPSILVANEMQDFVAILKSKIILQEMLEGTASNYPEASKRLLYSHGYLYNSENIKLNLICSKANPYKSEFLQKLNVSNTRVGIPEIQHLF